MARDPGTVIVEIEVEENYEDEVADETMIENHAKTVWRERLRLLGIEDDVKEITVYK